MKNSHSLIINGFSQSEGEGTPSFARNSQVESPVKKEVDIDMKSHNEFEAVIKTNGLTNIKEGGSCLSKSQLLNQESTKEIKSQVLKSESDDIFNFDSTSIKVNKNPTPTNYKVDSAEK